MSDLTTARLRDEIRAYLEKTGMGPTYFGVRAAGNSRLVERLEAGKTVTLQTAEKVRKFMTTATNHGVPPPAD